MVQRVHGTFAPVPTPIGSDGRFHAPTLDSHLRWLASEGLDGAVILGTNGEFPSFTLAERRQIAESAADSATGLRLLLGVGSCSILEVEELLKVAASCGYDAVLCPPPFYFRSAPVAGLASFFKRVLSVSELPVLLYHIPQVTGVPIDDALLSHVRSADRLAGVKDSTADRNEMSRLIAHFPTGSYMVGTDRLVSRCLECGGSGSITAGASVVPALVARAGSDSDAQERLDAVRDLLEEYGVGAAVKAILRRMGFGEYGARPPLPGLDEHLETELVSKFELLTMPPINEA